MKIADLVKEGKLAGIADIRDETSVARVSVLSFILKRDAVARVRAQQPLQAQPVEETSARTCSDRRRRAAHLSLDGFIPTGSSIRIEVIVRRTRFRLAKAEADAHIQRGYAKALDALDEVIALIRRSPVVEAARTGLIALLDVDELQADAILALPLRRLAALERQKILDRLAELEREIAEYQAILASESRQREIVTAETHRHREQVR